MNAVNYDKLFQKEQQKQDKSKRLLLHVCCAPCLTYCLEQLQPCYKVTAYFYNPNITDGKEYLLRLATLANFLADYRKTTGAKVPLIVPPYITSEFYTVSRGYEQEKEGGSRCGRCFELRLANTAEYAAANGYDAFCTTLTVSPHKNSQLINQIAADAANYAGVPFVFSDFCKREGYKRSTELSELYRLYRQNYCGCEYSKRQD